MRRRWIILLLAGLSLALAPAARSAQPVQAYPANAAQAPDPAPEYVPGELILGLKDDVELKALSLPQGMRAAAVSSELARLQSALVRVPPGQEEAYRKKMVNQPGVLFVEPNYIVYPVDTTPNDPLYPDQWGLPAVGAPAAWNITTGSEAVIVAVIDSGIDPGHPEFAGRLLTGYDFVRNTDSLIDPCGHGTHVAGIIAASGNNGIGIAGVDWQARILPLRVLNDRCSGTVANIARALVYAVDHHGAQVINLSLGRTAPSRLLENATYYAYRRGAALIAAAGNSGCGLGGSPSSVVYPARYPWTLAVSAIDSSHLPAWFSSCGAEVDLAAPGVGILSTTPMQGNFFYQSPTVPNEYGSLSGTSMAAPHVSGAAALLAGRGFEHPDAIFKALNDSARDIDILGFDNK
ncbi:MAG: S8 family peptidase, partial [Anaerolineaceae bacterium]|nr:S8 family peptidase [Anaerolineaceae bacterium]